MAVEAGDSRGDEPCIKQHRVELSQHSDKQNECGLKGKSQGPSRVTSWLFVLGVCPLPAQEGQSGLQCGSGGVPTLSIMNAE